MILAIKSDCKVRLQSGNPHQRFHCKNSQISSPWPQRNPQRWSQGKVKLSEAATALWSHEAADGLRSPVDFYTPFMSLWYFLPYGNWQFVWQLSLWLQSMQRCQAALQEALQEASTLRDLDGNQPTSQLGSTGRTNDYHVKKQSITPRENP